MAFFGRIDWIINIESTAADQELNMLTAKAENANAKMQGLSLWHEQVIDDLNNDREVARNELGVLEAEYERAQRQMEAQLRDLGSRVKTFVVRSFSLLTQTLSLFGVTLPPVLNASVRLIFTIWEQYLVVKAAEATLATAPGQQWRWITVGLAIASAAISLIAAIKQQVEAQQIQRDIEAAQQIAAGGIGGRRGVTRLVVDI